MSSGEFAKKINAELRAGRGVVVDGYSMPEEHRAMNDFIRSEAGRNTFEQDLESGKITHVNGQPLDKG